jgi:hypothetical protein
VRHRDSDFGGGLPVCRVIFPLMRRISASKRVILIGRGSNTNLLEKVIAYGNNRDDQAKDGQRIRIHRCA